MDQVQTRTTKDRSETGSRELIITGQDNATIVLERAREPALVRIVGNEASDKFLVNTYQQDGTIAASLVATTDPYEGVHPVDFGPVGHVMQFQVTASGPWRIEIVPLTADIVRARTFNVPFHYQGRGSDVLFLGEAVPGRLTVIDCGDSHLVIETYNSGLDFLAIEKPQSGQTLDLAPDTHAIVVMSLGPWEIDVSSAP